MKKQPKPSVFRELIRTIKTINTPNKSRLPEGSGQVDLMSNKLVKAYLPSAQAPMKKSGKRAALLPGEIKDIATSF